VSADVPTAAANQQVEWEYEGMEFEVELWDTAGQEALGALRAIAYPDSNVIMLTYDMSRKTSLENIPDWKEEIEDNCTDYYGLVLVGTKHDLWEERCEEGDEDCVTEEEVAAVSGACKMSFIHMLLQMAEEIGAKFSLYTSGKTGRGLGGEEFEEDDDPDLRDMILDICACGHAGDETE